MVIGLRMTRRWRLYDAILLIAATAVAMAPARLLAPEMIPVVRKLELIRLFDYAYVQDLFARKMSSGRMESIRLQFRRMVDAFTGSNQRRVRRTDHRTSQLESPEKRLEGWVMYHTNHGRVVRPGIPLAGSALGFALAQDGFFLAFPFLLLWSFCLTIQRLIPPRPDWAAIFRQPGWWACFGSLLGVAVAFTVENIIVWPAPSIVVPVTVLVAWLALGVSRRWESEASWIDRGGRLLGVLWFGTIPVYLVGFVYSRLI